MATVFEKLNLKDQQEIAVLNAPASFEPELAKLPVITIHHNLASVPAIHFLLAFVKRKAEVDALAPQIAKHAKGDAIVWFAYPKGSSKKLTCDFNRDTGWVSSRLSALKPYAPSPSTRTGPPSAFAAPSSSKIAVSIVLERTSLGRWLPGKGAFEQTQQPGSSGTRAGGAAHISPALCIRARL